jgi:uncharacterized protein (DUF1501 family)
MNMKITMKDEYEEEKKPVAAAAPKKISLKEIQAKQRAAKATKPKDADFNDLLAVFENPEKAAVYDQEMKYMATFAEKPKKEVAAAPAVPAAAQAASSSAVKEESRAIVIMRIYSFSYVLLTTPAVSCWRSWLLTGYASACN